MANQSHYIRSNSKVAGDKLVDQTGLHVPSGVKLGRKEYLI